MEGVERNKPTNRTGAANSRCLSEHPSPYTKTQEVQTEVSGPLYENMVAELHNLRTQNTNLQELVKANSTKFQMNEFEGKDDKVKYFTGLPTFNVLITLYSCLEAFLPHFKQMTRFQVFIMTLMRLRLNLSVQFFAFEFGVPVSTISTCFAEVIDIMYSRMEPLIKWPDHEQLQRTMPMHFRKYFGTKVVVIIDCFEVFIQRPATLMARAQTWSSYKHHNTAKFLVGITPQGSVSFVSKAYGGRASDRFVIENCGILNKVTPGNVILSYKGFDLKDSVVTMCAEVKNPAYTQGKNQLSPLYVESSKQLANLSSQVVRVIELVRQKYTVLNSILPLDLLTCKGGEKATTIDKIAVVCCALVNMCESLVELY